MSMPIHQADALRPKLLLVDDDAALRDVLARAFEKRGFDVAVAADEGEAVQSAPENPPDYAVLDLRLGNGGGLNLVPTLRKLNRDMRIVVVTGYGSIATAIEAIKLGATYYLCKPVGVDEIISAFSYEAGAGSIAPRDKPMSVKRLEWELISEVLRQHNGNISQAARALSMHRRTLQRKLAKRPVKN